MGGRLEEAMRFLGNILAEGPVDSETVRRKAAEAGISEKTLKRAKSDLGVESRRAGSWSSLWSLPAEQTPSSEAKTDESLPATLPTASRGIAWLRENSEAVAEAVRENRGLLSYAARELGVHRNSLARFRDENDWVRDLVEEAQESLVDELEDVAFGRVLRGGGNQQLLMFLLKTKGKARGYVEAAKEREAITQENVRIELHWPAVNEHTILQTGSSVMASQEIVDVEEFPEEDVGHRG
jgi:hypothetical protein